MIAWMHVLFIVVGAVRSRTAVTLHLCENTLHGNAAKESSHTQHLRVAVMLEGQYANVTQTLNKRWKNNDYGCLDVPVILYDEMGRFIFR